MSFKIADFGTSRKLIYDFLLVINTNLPPILHRFRDIAFDRSKIAIFGYLSCVYPPPPPNGGVPWDDLRKIFSWMSVDGRGTKWRRNIAENFNRLNRVIAYSERELKFTFAKNVGKTYP